MTESTRCWEAPLFATQQWTPLWSDCSQFVPQTWQRLKHTSPRRKYIPFCQLAARKSYVAATGVSDAQPLRALLEGVELWLGCLSSAQLTTGFPSLS